MRGFTTGSYGFGSAARALEPVTAGEQQSIGSENGDVTEEFVMRLDAGMLAFFRDITEEMVRRFGISHPEAVARLNATYGSLEIAPYPDLMCHELPEFWAYGAYYRPDTEGRLPCGDTESDAAIDFTTLETRPAPVGLPNGLGQQD